MKTRIKFGQTPGDIPKRDKIAMLEQSPKDARSKAYKKMLLSRERAVLKQRTRKEIEESS